MTDDQTRHMTPEEIEERRERVAANLRADRERDVESGQRAMALIEDAEHDEDDRTRGEGAGAPAYPGTFGAYDADDEEDEDLEYEEDRDLFAVFWDRRWWVLCGVVAIVVVFLIARGIGGGGEPAPEAPQDDPGGQARRAAPARPEAPSGEIEETGVVIGEPVVKEEEGTYYLRAGEIAWKGRLENTETGEELTLEGPTAAQCKRGVTLPQGSVTTCVFGRAEPDKPILHATLHRVTVGTEENTTGTYKAIDEAGVLVEGTYSDTRDGGTVVRTYTERAPGEAAQESRSYRVSFEAPPGVPIPVLVGWEPPAEAEIDEAA